MSRKSSTFYQLVKDIGDGYKSVYEFHTVVNGNLYYTEYELLPSGRTGWIGNPTRVYDKDKGNDFYKKLLSEGYKFSGIYEMDIMGAKHKINADCI